MHFKNTLEIYKFRVVAFMIGIHAKISIKTSVLLTEIRNKTIQAKLKNKDSLCLEVKNFFFDLLYLFDLISFLNSFLLGTEFSFLSNNQTQHKDFFFPKLID